MEQKTGKISKCFNFDKPFKDVHMKCRPKQKNACSKRARESQVVPEQAFKNSANNSTNPYEPLQLF